jgi:hypothetical protein
MTWADIVYWLPTVTFIGCWIGGGIIFHEINALAHLRIVTAEEVEKLEEKAAFIAHSDDIVRRALLLFDMGCKEEAALELARLGEHAEEDLRNEGIL